MATPSFFREIDNAFDIINRTTRKNGRTVNLSESDIQFHGKDKLKEERFKTLKTLSDYIDKGDWLKSKAKVEFLANYKLSTADYAKRTERDEASIRQSIKRNSDMLRKKFGEDFIQRILTGDEQELIEVMFELHTADISQELLTKYITEPFKDILNKAPDYTYNLGDLENEITFLQMCSLSFFKNYYESLDKDKLAYLVNTIEGMGNDGFKVQCELYKATQTKQTKLLIVELLNCFKVRDEKSTLLLLQNAINKEINNMKKKQL